MDTSLDFLNYDHQYAIFKNFLYKKIKNTDFTRFENFLLNYINSSTTINEKARRLYISRKFLSEYLHAKNMVEYVPMIKNFKIQLGQVFKYVGANEKKSKYMFITKGWKPFYEQKDEWLKLSYLRWGFFNKFYHNEIRKFNKLTNPQTHKYKIKYFLNEIMILRKQNFRREEFLPNKELI